MNLDWETGDLYQDPLLDRFENGEGDAHRHLGPSHGLQFSMDSNPLCDPLRALRLSFMGNSEANGRRTASVEARGNAESAKHSEHRGVLAVVGY